MASLSDQIGTRLAGRYELERELGKGGMATAYLAQDLSLDCPVVVKSPHATLLTDPTFARRFQQEMRSLVQLNHPHIVKVTDVGEHEGLPFIVMQYLGGGSLRDRQGRPKTSQPPEHLRSWLPKIAEALDFMHDRGYVHRDVKPANILFDEHGHAYLSDFGVAKAIGQGDTEVDRSLTGTGMVLGTPDYLAPEVILGKGSDGRADQYALAISVYELLSGRGPFDGPTPTAVMVQHSAAAPRPLQKLLPHLPEALCAAVHRGLAKKPQERYATCRAFADAVLAALSAQPTPAPTDTGGLLGDWIAEARAPLPPSPLEIARAPCPQCGKSLKLPAESAGRNVACPNCRTRLTVSSDYRSLTAASETGVVVGTSAVGLPPALVAGSGPHRTAQFKGDTPAATTAVTNSATNTALTIQTWYRLPWVQATLAVAVLVAGISLGLLWRGEPRGELANLPVPVPATTINKIATPKPLPGSSTRPSTTPPNPMPLSSTMTPLPVATPLLAVAPFGAVTARGHQEAWARHLGTTVETTNNIGMKLALIPAGEFMMGSPADDMDASLPEKPQHRVRITKPFYLGITEVTQSQWQQVMGTRPWSGKDFGKEGSDFAATYVSWEDAVEFCRKLSVKEGKTYRLPTEAEWEYACRGGTATRYYFGDGESQLEDYAWCEKNVIDIKDWYAHGVGRKRANAWGLFDMHGNVSEWCGDFYYDYDKASASEPSGPVTGSSRVYRGGGWGDEPAYCRSASRLFVIPDDDRYDLGFRVALVPSAAPSATTITQPPTPPVTVKPAPDTPTSLVASSTAVPSLAIAPFDAVTARKHQEAWARHLGTTVETTNSIGMKLVLIPAGEFMMGAPAGENPLLDEGPQQRVRITKPYYLGVTEVTQGHWKSVMGTSPWSGKEYVKEGSDFPATNMSRDDAVEFCKKLGTLEGKQYRLPTEAEWEYACRAGTTTKYSFGDDESRLGDYAWYDKNANNIDEKYAHGVGLKRANAWGLFDMHGNVLERCGYYGETSSSDPSGTLTAPYRVSRGGCWGYSPVRCRSAPCDFWAPYMRLSFLGLRVALVP